MIWYESGGEGSRTILLLHGLGATSAVWADVRTVLEQRRLGRWIAPDLSGHGRSEWQAHYSVGRLAAELADLVRENPHVFVLGHSLGAYLGLALASRWFGVQVSGVVGLGPKITWSDADLQTARELATRPVRWYATSDEAWGRYRRVSGLDPKVAPGEHWLSGGLTQGDQGWRLSQDPRTFGVAGAPFDTLVSSAQTRVILARGEHDSMVSLEELRRYATDVHEVLAAGHNAHVEKPEMVTALLERVIQSEMDEAERKGRS